MCGMYTEADLFKGFSLPLDSLALEGKETTLSWGRVYCKEGEKKFSSSSNLSSLKEGRKLAEMTFNIYCDFKRISFNTEVGF